MMQEWADKLGKGGSRIRVELIALSKPRGLNSFLNVRFVPGADVATPLYKSIEGRLAFIYNY